MAQQKVQTATLLDWVTSPDWLSLDEACHLTGYDLPAMQSLVDEGMVNLDERGLIDKRSLWEFLESLILALHWAD
jgi:hypothetical protein